MLQHSVTLESRSSFTNEAGLKPSVAGELSKNLKGLGHTDLRCALAQARKRGAWAFDLAFLWLSAVGSPAYGCARSHYIVRGHRGRTDRGHRRHPLALRASSTWRSSRVQPKAATSAGRDRHEYAASWGFSIVESVLQGGREWGETESEEEAAESSTVLEPPAQKAKPAPPKAPVVTTQVISVPVKAAVETSLIVSLPVQAKPKVKLATTSKGVPQRRTTDLGDEREGTELQSEAASSENLEPVRESIRPSAVIRPSSTPKSLANPKSAEVVILLNP